MPCIICGNNSVDGGMCIACAVEDLKQKQQKSNPQEEQRKRNEYFGKTGKINLNEVVNK